MIYKHQQIIPVLRRSHFTIPVICASSDLHQSILLNSNQKFHKLRRCISYSCDLPVLRPLTIPYLQKCTCVQRSDNRRTSLMTNNLCEWRDSQSNDNSVQKENKNSPGNASSYRRAVMQRRREWDRAPHASVQRSRATLISTEITKASTIRTEESL